MQYAVLEQIHKSLTCSNVIRMVLYVTEHGCVRVENAPTSLFVRSNLPLFLSFFLDHTYGRYHGYLNRLRGTYVDTPETPFEKTSELSGCGLRAVGVNGRRGGSAVYTRAVPQERLLPRVGRMPLACSGKLNLNLKFSACVFDVFFYESNFSVHILPHTTTYIHNTYIHTNDTHDVSPAQIAGKFNFVRVFN